MAFSSKNKIIKPKQACYSVRWSEMFSRQIQLSNVENSQTWSPGKQIFDSLKTK